MDDFKCVDFSVYNSLKFFRDQNLEEFEDIIEQYFTSDVSSVLAVDGSNTHELVYNGATIRVTNSNKEDFIVKKSHFIGYKSVN